MIYSSIRTKLVKNDNEKVTSGAKKFLYLPQHTAAYNKNDIARFMHISSIQ